MLAILSWLNQCFTWLYQAFTWVLNGCVEVLNFFIFSVVDGFLTVALTFINSLNFAGLAFDLAGYYGLIPETGLYLISQLGIPQGLSMLGLAVGIRMALNLIPSVITRI